MTLEELKLVEEVLQVDVSQLDYYQYDCYDKAKEKLEKVREMIQREIKMKEFDFITGKIKEDANQS